ncbi:complex I subunit 5 family protein [Roseovarius sp. D0-M9]|uniref:complex I subunit 5 family protein n=1 Tax=Roseovarius sp. D0-M9 TaxID=3127117 RepID=UPI00300FF22C
MMWSIGAPLPLLALVLPMVLGCIAALPPMRRHAIRLLPLAPLPALWLGLIGAQGDTSVPFLLLGVELRVTPITAIFTAMTAALWLAAGLYAQSYMDKTQRPAVFTGFWCLTLAGNLGVFLAADVVTFYVAFATVSLASYVLIVHDATREALRAGRVYIALVIIGEVCLLAAFVLGMEAADSLDIGDIRMALGDIPLGGLAAALLIVGFGIKAGLMPLHFWLPLAHPAAPTPASAVLSGAIVKAGIIGLMLFLPAKMDFADWLMWLGFAGAFGAALLGLLRSDPKAILAYSTISQMSLVIALIAAAISASDGPDFDRVTLYALHHGLAKGALFLSVGLVAACAGGWRRAMVLLVALVALSVSGAPLTGGNLTKLAAKSGLEGMAETALTLTAITTTLVLAWFLWQLGNAKSGKGRPNMFLELPTLALGLGALAAPWLLGPDWSGLEPGYPLKPGSIWSSSWPIIAGVVAAVIWARYGAPIRAGASQFTAWLVRLAVRPRAYLPHFATSTTRRLDAGRNAAEDGLRSALGTVAEAAGTAENYLKRQRYLALLLILLAVVIAVQEWLWR